MSDWPTFLLACLALLAAPGPTNTLIATSGATAGLRRSGLLPLLAAAGYTAGTTILGVVIAPLLRSSHWIDAGMRLACAGFLVAIAVHLWREGADAKLKGEPVRPSRLFAATLLNPKNIVFALAIVPHLDDGRLSEAAPYLLVMFLMAILVAIAWAAAGAIARHSTQGRVDTGVLRRIGAGFLGLFAALMAGSAVETAVR